MNDKLKVKINTKFIKLDSFLKYVGVAQTGGQAKNMVQNKEIFVNGEKCIQRGKKLYPGYIVTSNNKDYEIEADQ